MSNHDNFDVIVESDRLHILDDFKSNGLRASFHYADDTASGEWRLANALEGKCRNCHNFTGTDINMRETHIKV